MFSYQGGSKSSKGRRMPTSFKSLALLELWEFCFQAMPYKGSGIHGPFCHPRSPLLTACALTHPRISQTTPTPVLHPPLQFPQAPPHQPLPACPLLYQELFLKDLITLNNSSETSGERTTKQPLNENQGHYGWEYQLVQPLH